jgi:hypothetical protein
MIDLHRGEKPVIMTHPAAAANTLPCVDIHLDDLTLTGLQFAAPAGEPASGAPTAPADIGALAPARPPRRLSDEEDEEEEGMIDTDDEDEDEDEDEEGEEGDEDEDEDEDEEEDEDGEEEEEEDEEDEDDEEEDDDDEEEDDKD